jgi:hypothetical protein
MIHLTANSPIQIAIQPVDFRKGIDGLVALCEYDLQQSSRSGTLFVFKNRKSTMVRILAYEKNGYWLMTKRLSTGHYQGWPKGKEPVSTLQAYQLRQLLSGLIMTASLSND